MLQAQLHEALVQVQPDSLLAVHGETFPRFHALTLRTFAAKWAEPDQVDDLVHDVLISIIQHLRQVGALPLVGQRRWLRTAVCNRARDWLRKKRCRRECSLEIERQAHGDPPARMPETIDQVHVSLRLAELRTVVDDMREDLGEANHRIVVGHFFEERPHSEVAAELGLTEKQVRKRLTRALKKLRPRLAVFVGDFD